MRRGGLRVRRVDVQVLAGLEATVSLDARQDVEAPVPVSLHVREALRSEGAGARRVVQHEVRAGPIEGRVEGAQDPTNLERRRGPGRRLTDFVKTAEEGEMNREQYLFLLAIDAFKRVNHKTFPSWTDVLEIIRKLGYRKTMPSELNLGPRAADWTEKPDAPAGVTKLAEKRDE